MSDSSSPIPIAYLISDIDKALAFEWIAESLNPEQFDLHFVLFNKGDSQLEDFLQAHKLPVKRIRYRGKKDVPRAFWECYRYLRLHKIKIVHCHLFTASAIGLSAARLLGIPKRFSTRHFSTFHHQYFPRAVYYDKMINYLASGVIAISQNVYDILVEKEKLAQKKAHLIHHGFKLLDFKEPDAQKVKMLGEKYSLDPQGLCIGVIARQTEWKGIQYIIPAFKRLLEEYPQAVLLLANAKGDYKAHIDAQLSEISAENYRCIPFESDLVSLYGLMDFYVHCPIDAQIEAFGQTYVEALAARVPSVFTLSGVAKEFVVPNKNALVVPFKNSEAIYQALLNLLKNPALREEIRANAWESVFPKFSLEYYITKLQRLYLGKLD